jgi:hypothetical protein
VGDLDRITWLSVSGYVNAEPAYGETATVMNGFYDLVLSVFGARTPATRLARRSVCPRCRSTSRSSLPPNS